MRSQSITRTLLILGVVLLSTVLGRAQSSQKFLLSGKQTVGTLLKVHHDSLRVFLELPATQSGGELAITAEVERGFGLRQQSLKSLGVVRWQLTEQTVELFDVATAERVSGALSRALERTSLRPVKQQWNLLLGDNFWDLTLSSAALQPFEEEFKHWGIEAGNSSLPYAESLCAALSTLKRLAEVHSTNKPPSTVGDSRRAYRLAEWVRNVKQELHTRSENTNSPDADLYRMALTTE